MSGLLKTIAPLALLLSSVSAFAQPITIGETEFPLGESAFPSASECLDPSGCGSEDNKLIDFSDPLLRPVAAANALLGHRLDLTTIDLDDVDEIHLTFPVPIANQNGVDIYIGQAEFLADLADVEGLNDVQMRFGSAQDWHTISRSQFARDADVLATVFYQDPEIKSDAYRLWFVKLDLADFGIAADQTFNTVSIRGVVNSSGSGLDAPIVGNLNLRLKVTPLDPMPCHVRAESVGWSAEIAVKNAPESCGVV
jgi:hypothetical protein